ncbi:MAG: hypothetical protein B7Z55_06935, partial [Planctomycetales bacterium 12-60-4]
LASTSPPRKRFLREARTAAAVTHENIVAIHAVEEVPIPYLVMEYIPGETLQQRLDAKGPLDVPEFLRIGQQVAAGLAAAHSVHLIHRDIKPANILLTGGANDRAKISDFGLARAVDDATLTSSGLIAGTPMYMAPEQARGEPLDHRADLFSLGSVLYQMVSGRPPFRAANTVAVLKRVCEDTPRPLDDVIPETPDWLESIIFRLLEKSRDDRYQAAQEVADLLAQCQNELRINGKVTCVEGRSGAAETQIFQPVKSKSTGVGAKKRLPGLLFGGVIVIAAVIGLTMWKRSPQPDTNSAPVLEQGLAQSPNATKDTTKEESPRGLVFDGVDDYVHIPDFQVSGDQPLTIEGVFIAEQPPPASQALILRSNTFATIGTGLMNWGTISNWQGREHLVSTVNSIQPGIRTHIALVFQEGRCSLYINGDASGNQPYTLKKPVQPSGEHLLCLGAAMTTTDGQIQPGQFFRGQIEWVRISSQARYSTAFDPPAVPATDEETLALYRFDEGTGDVLHDVSGNGHDGKIVGATWVTVEPRKQPASGWHGWPADAPKPAIAPFSLAQAMALQEAWAQYLGVPVEYTNSVGMTFRLVPPGEFMMGAPEAELETHTQLGVGDFWDEIFSAAGPQHTVILTQPFYLMACEVTQQQYQRVAGTNPSAFSKSGARAAFSGEDATDHYPVDSVSWMDAVEYCNQLGELEQRPLCYSRSGDDFSLR